jgi:fructose-1,6-bisphosphatase/inositol monophosphatase family enzyme
MQERLRVRMFARELARDLDIVKTIALSAGALLRNHQSAVGTVRYKDDRSIVCTVDDLSSAYITTQLKKSFPADAILDEERPLKRWDEYSRVWIVDPLDGTIDYVRGGTNYGIMIALLHEHVPVLGVTYKPATDECAYAIRGQHAFVNDRELHVSSSSEIHLLVSKFRSGPVLEDLLQKVNPASVRHMPGSLKTVEIAKGTATAFACPPDITMNVWDLCAPSVILEEAGGKITDIYGHPIRYDAALVHKYGVIASNGVVHDQLIERIHAL